METYSGHLPNDGARLASVREHKKKKHFFEYIYIYEKGGVLMMTERKKQYLELADDHTEPELATLLKVAPQTIRRYAKELGVKPKPVKFRNEPPSVWKQRFDSQFAGRIEIKGDLYRAKAGHLSATCKCLSCQTEWTANINAKINSNTGCIVCDKGNHGNKYDEQTVTAMMNKIYAGQWILVTYGHYSKKDSVIRCSLCGYEHVVKLANFIKTTTMRCTKCQTGSFGEHVIANTLLYNNIPFEREKTIKISNHKYRLDFLIDNQVGLEYSGSQHFEKGLYYNDEINKGVALKRKWCIERGYRFVELTASYDVQRIVDNVAMILNVELKTPTSDFFKSHNPDMQSVLTYMKTHSARQTMKDLHIPVTKIKKFVYLAGYKSISDWQSDTKD